MLGESVPADENFYTLLLLGIFNQLPANMPVSTANTVQAYFKVCINFLFVQLKHIITRNLMQDRQLYSQ